MFVDEPPRKNVGGVRRTDEPPRVFRPQFFKKNRLPFGLVRRMFVDEPPRFFSGGLDEHSANIRRTPPGKTRGGSPNPLELFTFAEPARLVPAPTVRDLYAYPPPTDCNAM